jgi:hypothetical protein
MSEDTGGADEEADRDVRSDRCGERFAHSQHRGQAQRAEDQADEAAEQADAAADQHRLPRSHPPRLRRRPPPQQVDRHEQEDDADRREERVLGNLSGQVPADDRADHRRWRQPGDESPVDAAGADVRDRRRQRGDPRDADVRARAGRWVRGDEDDQRQPDVPENEPDSATRDRDEEAPRGDERELHVEDANATLYP